MPVDDAARPIGHVLVNLLREIEQECVARAVVEPIGGLDVVAEPDSGPVTVSKILARLRVEPPAVLGHERKDPLISAKLVK